MRTFQDKRERRRHIYSRLSLVVLLVVILLLSHAVGGIYSKKRLADSNLASARREASMLKVREDSLRSDLARLSNLAGREAELRAKFQIARPGEELVVLLDDATSTTQTATATPTDASKSFWSFVSNFFR